MVKTLSIEVKCDRICALLGTGEVLTVVRVYLPWGLTTMVSV